MHIIKSNKKDEIVHSKEKRTFSFLNINVRSTEIWFICCVIVIIITVTSIPYIYGYLSCPFDKYFSGIVYNMHDTAQYLSWMREAGRSFFSGNKLTSEPSAEIFLNLHWWIAGKLAHIFGLTFSQVYQLLRFLAISLLVVVTYAFCKFLFEDYRKRYFAFFLSLFTSGLGWIWVFVKYITLQKELLFPLDVYALPGNAFWVMVASPHLTFAAALTIGVLFLVSLGLKKQQFNFALGAAMLALFLGLGHIYDLVTVWAILGILGVVLVLRDGWSWQTFTYLIIVVIVSSPAAFYWGWVSSSAHPVWKQALSQYDNLGVFTPDPLHLIILLGGTFLIAMATFDGFISLKNQSEKLLLIKCWFVVVPFLIYLPLHFQIMLLTGYNLPISVLATKGLFDRILPMMSERKTSGKYQQRYTIEGLNRKIPILLLIAVSATNLYLLSWRVVDLNRHRYPFYLHRDDVAAMGWLEKNTPPDETILSSFEIGHFIPGFTGDRPFLGNAVMTMDFYKKRKIMISFFNSEMSDIERQSLMLKYGIRYIFWGPAEKVLGKYDPGRSDLFVRVYSSANTGIFAFHNGQ